MEQDLCGGYPESCTNITHYDVRSSPLDGMVVRVMLSGLAGIIVGSEREFGYIFVRYLMGSVKWHDRGKPPNRAGLRTHFLVSMASTMFTLASSRGFAAKIPYKLTSPGDPGLVAAQIVSGIGFLGAGTINRAGGDLRGLTTASSIWMVAAIGMLFGAGVDCNEFAITGQNMSCPNSTSSATFIYFAFVCTMTVVFLLPTLGLLEEFVHHQATDLAEYVVPSHVEIMSRRKTIHIDVVTLCGMVTAEVGKLTKYSVDIVKVLDQKNFALLERNETRLLLEDEEGYKPKSSQRDPEESSEPARKKVATAEAETGVVPAASESESIKEKTMPSIRDGWVHLALDFEIRIPPQSDSLLFITMVEKWAGNKFIAASVGLSEALPVAHRNHVKTLKSGTGATEDISSS